MAVDTVDKFERSLGQEYLPGRYTRYYASNTSVDCTFDFSEKASKDEIIVQYLYKHVNNSIPFVEIMPCLPKLGDHDFIDLYSGVCPRKSSQHVHCKAALG